MRLMSFPVLDCLSDLLLYESIDRGGDPRTLKNWIRTLERLGFIERRNIRVYKMNLDSIPELLNVMVKSGQKKLM